MDNTSQAGQVNRDLLIVDGDVSAIATLENLFKKYYNIQKSVGGKSALNLIANGFRPGVVIANQEMPEISGSRFLAETIKIIPDTVRILLLSGTAPAEILPQINEGKAYMYLTKPYNELQLMQVVRNGFNYYDTFQKNKFVSKQLNATLSKFKQIKESSGADNNLLNEATQTFANVFNLHEKFYFYYKHQAIEAIVASIAEEMRLSVEDKNILITAARLINSLNIAMPEKFRLHSPDELLDTQRKDYFSYFNKSIKILAASKYFETVADILGQIWERYDGTGFPKGLRGDDISQLSQIIGIGNMFHNQVYRIKPEDYDKLVSEGVLEQIQSETQDRHLEAMKYLFRNQNWFSKKVFEAFKNVLNSKKCHALVPKRGTLKSKYSIITIEKEEEEKLLANDEIKAIIVEIGGMKYSEKEILVQDLKPGMMNARDLVSTKGMLIVRSEQKLTEALVNNIKQLESVKMLKETIQILTPDWNAD